MWKVVIRASTIFTRKRNWWGVKHVTSLAVIEWCGRLILFGLGARFRLDWLIATWWLCWIHAVWGTGGARPMASGLWKLFTHRFEFEPVSPKSEITGKFGSFACSWRASLKSSLTWNDFPLWMAFNSQEGDETVGTTESPPSRLFWYRTFMAKFWFSTSKIIDNAANDANATNTDSARRLGLENPTIVTWRRVMGGPGRAVQPEQNIDHCKSPELAWQRCNLHKEPHP